MDDAPRMTRIKVVLGTGLLRAADGAVRRLKTNRSALFREAIRVHLERLDHHDREKRDREGYVRDPDSLDELSAWNNVADWPED